MPNQTIDTYNTLSESFKQQYLSLNTETVHQVWLANYLPASGVVLDVGAGVGRDAKYFAEKGLEVIAVEPAQALSKLGKKHTKSLSVQWLEDRLPELSSVFSLNMRFDLVLLSAVWMHIPPTSRERAFRKLSNLLKPGGHIVLSLRHGDHQDAREMYPVSIDEIKLLAQKQGLVIRLAKADDDHLNRPAVFWETVVIQLPDDGSGAFPIVRNILINDSKSSTYKLALIRTLLRIADGHPGAVITRTDKYVTIPLGLVALYWARQYNPLLKHGIQQNSVAQKGLAFVKPEGWLALSGFTATDFSIGVLFKDNDAQALHLTFKHIIDAIEKGPVKFTTFANSNKSVFELNRTKLPKKLTSDSLYLDFVTLKSYGELFVPVKIWDLMSLYAHWIEPVVLQEWVSLMHSFKDNRDNPHRQPCQLYPLLNWQAAVRKTDFVRQRVEKLRESERVLCVWEHKALKSKFVIDHCLPYARCLNNDLWNLMPTAPKVNASKSDKVPTQKRYQQSHDVIVHWWKKAWIEQTDKERFFTEANLSLPDLTYARQNYEDVFEALKLQSTRVAEMQQLRRW